MLLKGSCHCQKVGFEVESLEPVPYQRCYCSICRKTSGGGGFLINLGGESATLKIKGEENLHFYQALINGKQGPHKRFFCKECGSHLYAINSDYPDLVHPVASAIDSELPTPRQTVHMMTESKANWVKIKPGPLDEQFAEYPSLSLKDWHKINHS